MEHILIMVTLACWPQMQSQCIRALESCTYTYMAVNRIGEKEALKMCFDDIIVIYPRSRK